MCPYIPFEQRQEARQRFIDGQGINEPGELAYIIADAIDSFVGSQYRFERLAQALGAIESAKAEFVEQVVKPYEATKRAENGCCFILSAGDPL